MKVSVIMPVYNAEEYIGEAIESWARQTLQEKELICIDDGSTDNSAKIVEKYQGIYENIKLYKQENQGSGVARNYGLQKAEGEYVCFLDADDFYIDEHALEKIYCAIIRRDVEVGAGFLTVYDGSKYRQDMVLRKLLSEEKEEVISYQSFQFDYQYQCYLFSRKLLERNCIKFPRYRRFQDPPFLTKVLFYAQNFLLVNTEFYGYRYGYRKLVYTPEMVRDLGGGYLKI